MKIKLISYIFAPCGKPSAVTMLDLIETLLKFGSSTYFYITITIMILSKSLFSEVGHKLEFENVVLGV